ncbi:MAG: acyltransferase [Nanoarchaeota archaeon]
MTYQVSIDELANFISLLLSDFYMVFRLILERLVVYPLNLIPSLVGVILRRGFYKFLFKKMGKKVVIKEFNVIKHLGNIEIGNYSEINQFCFINAMGGLKIGDYCQIAPMVSLVTFNYKKDNLPMPYIKQGEEKKSIELGNNVWLGNKVTVVAGVKIGDNSIIGANSVVTKDVPANSIAVGSPATVVKQFKNNKWVDIKYNK